MDWASFCREVCEISLTRKSENIGGPGIVVEIDESMFAKRKYHCGHNVKGVFGGRENKNKNKIFMECVADRTAKTLLGLITKKDSSWLHYLERLLEGL